MAFNSLDFSVFAVAFFILWPFFRGKDLSRWLFIILASFIFYGWWDWRFVPILISVGLAAFAAGLLMNRYPERKGWILAGSISATLGILVTFKFGAPILDNVNALLQSAGRAPVHLSPETLTLLTTLPVGISFFTFQSMSYAIDIYRGRISAVRSPSKYFAYISMFPHLMAGPIVRAVDLMPQLDRRPRTSEDQRYSGLKLILLGLFKKTVLADNLAPYVNHAFQSNLHDPSTLYWWIIITMFAYQIYFDFSGYTDIARGLARLMGYEFDINFNQPYQSKSVREFWTRWHISLTSWFMDYVYRPLAGNALWVSMGRSLFAVTVVFLLCGIWHGAGWHFLVWGALHAVYSVVERLSNWPLILARLPLGSTLSWLLTLVLVWIGWVFFRAQTWEDAMTILHHMFVFRLTGTLSIANEGLILIGGIFLWEVMKHLQLLKDAPAGISRTAAFKYLEPVGLASIAAASIFLRGKGSDFIYFQF